MKEALLQYIWEYQLFNLSELKTTDGKSIEVLERGKLNLNGGADFQHAKIKIDDVLWAGTVEIHKVTSDWFRHKHEKNRAYDNVVLHVVWEHDRMHDLPVLELKDRVSNLLLERYERLMNNQSFIPCSELISSVSPPKFKFWKERLISERLEGKVRFLEEKLGDSQEHLLQCFYEELAYSFGLKVNADAFKSLAWNLPFKLIRKYKSDLFQLEALLYGVGGFLTEEFDEEYPRALQKEFYFLQQKHKLNSLPKTIWNFGRIRPAAFPTVRIAQFAAFLHSKEDLFSSLLVLRSREEFYSFFSVSPSNYWQTHYVFNKKSEPKTKSLGKTAIDRIIINTLPAFLFYMGRLRNEESLSDFALKLYELFPKEKNSITQNFEKLGLAHKNAFDSQALVMLHKNYCSRKKCLKCSVGLEIFKNNE